MTDRTKDPAFPENPQWYRDAIIYELHVRAFHDGNGDGIGDFPGLTERLDYLRDLGITALWLLPFYPSPLRDDGYDIADYRGVHPDYGTLADFRRFLREAHRRGLRVITELVLNHTSDRHPWFQRARRAAPGSRERDFYVWSDTPDRFKGTRIIFKDFEASNWTWDPVARAYFWHRFYHHQPDLNYDNPAVRRAVLREMDFWLKMGVDGLRLDAVPYLFEREGTNCENLPETHDVLRQIRRHVEQRYGDRMLLAEANQWPEDAVQYFGKGDECHMAFHFPVMPRMFMALRMEDRFPIVDILEQTPAIPEGCQWAMFLRNHDELTLEMVTDEERDYMYRVYATDPRARINLGIRRRLAPLLGNDRRRIELMNGLLLALPGTPVIYYGDEIGMGDNIYVGDRNGVRTPMQWSGDRNAGFSRANSQRLYLPIIIDPEFHYEALNVEAQLNNPHTLLWWMRRVIALRKRHQGFGRGSLEFLSPENRKVLAFVRRHGAETLLVVANLSRFVQFAELDLAAFRGQVPVELFGRQRFPPIGEAPYVLSLGPHSFYWFDLEEAAVAEPEAAVRAGREPALVASRAGLAGLLDRDGRGREGRTRLEELLAPFLGTRRWFGGKARRLKGVRVLDTIPLEPAPLPLALVLLGAEYTEGESETYVVALGELAGEAASRFASEQPGDVIARIAGPSGESLLVEAGAHPELARALLETLARRRSLRGRAGDLVGIATRRLRGLMGPEGLALESTPLKAEQSNTSVRFGERMIMKLYRRAEAGPNPDVEILGRLGEGSRFPHAPALGGHLEYRPARGEARAVCLLQEFVPNAGDAWRLTLDYLERFFERVAAWEPGAAPLEAPRMPLVELARKAPSEAERGVIGLYLESARLLGKRTAEMHLTLGADTDDPAFAPEPFTPFYQRQLFQAIRNRVEATLGLLRRERAHLGGEEREVAERLLAARGELLARVRRVLDAPVSALRIRVHGDFHLGQVLWTGKDFVIIDFEGEPALALSARRIKRSPLRDVAGMLRSFHYAASAALRDQREAGLGAPGDLGEWARLWVSWVSAVFVSYYLDTAGGRFLPASDRDTGGLLHVYLLEKALYELAYELNNRPDWVRLPLHGILDLLDSP